jgi:hypothetical protein
LRRAATLVKGCGSERNDANRELRFILFTEVSDEANLALGLAAGFVTALGALAVAILNSRTTRKLERENADRGELAGRETSAALRAASLREPALECVRHEVVQLVGPVVNPKAPRGVRVPSSAT